MKPHSTFLKLFLGNLLVMGILLALGGWVAFSRLDAGYKHESQQNQDRTLRLATQHFEELWPLEQPRVDRICKQMFHDPTERLTVVVADGTVLGDSSADPHTMTNHRTPDRPEILAALSGQAGSNTRQSGTLGLPMRYAALPLRHDGQVVAAVRLAVPVKAIAEGESFLRQTLVWAAFAGIVAAVLLGLLINWIWYIPLRRVAIAARQLASGDLSKRARAGGGGELEELARSLNEMRDRLREQISRLDAQSRNLQTVMASLQEGVIATNPAGEIVMMNRAAGALLSVSADQASGKRLDTTVPVPELISVHDRAGKMNKTVSGQFDTDTPQGRRTIEVHAMPVADIGPDVACVLVIRDVTDLARDGHEEPVRGQCLPRASHAAGDDPGGGGFPLCRRSRRQR